MGYRDDAEALRQRNAELTAECERLTARVAELEARIADDNANAVLTRRIEDLREQNARLRADIARLDPHRTTEERERLEKTADIRKGVLGALGSLLDTE